MITNFLKVYTPPSSKVRYGGNKNEWDELNSEFPCTQYSNRRKGQPHRYVDLSKPDNIIARPLC